MLKWLVGQREELAKRLKASEQETLRLQGALAMVDETLRQARAQGGGGNVAAPAPQPQPTQAAPVASPTMTALRIGREPLQATEELRE